MGGHDAQAQTTADSAAVRLQSGRSQPGDGSAFVGAADDATAAFANPAGLARLNTRQVSAEGRVRRVETPFLRGGRISGFGDRCRSRHHQWADYGTDVDTRTSPAFVSLMLPVALIHRGGSPARRRASKTRSSQTASSPARPSLKITLTTVIANCRLAARERSMLPTTVRRSGCASANESRLAGTVGLHLPAERRLYAIRFRVRCLQSRRHARRGGNRNAAR